MEALLALLALVTALATLWRLQTLMQGSSAHERQRLEALAIVQSLHEQLRFGGPSEPALPADSPYLLTTQDLATDIPGLRARRSQVRWNAWRGQPAGLALDTLMPADPALDQELAGAVLLDRAPPRRDLGGRARPTPRHALIPASASPLGDGRSAWQPHAGLPAVWLIDDASGAVVARCGGLASRVDGVRQAEDCIATGGLLIGGVVRFATDTDHPGAAEAESPLSAALPLDLAMRPAASGDTAPDADCGHDAPSALPVDGAAHPPGVVRYLCVVSGSGQPPRWSGRLEIVPQGWSIGLVNRPPPAPPVRRVCRYSADHDRNGQVDPAEHPAVHRAVDTALGDQNFLVVRAGAACPRDAPAGLPGSLDMNWLDDSTVPHQPP
ncbi:hypothetical protein EV685_1019 [Sphaerotilus mobilis]|uniref:Uncharacterized protein n=1 Tax=Sphaerotilus mobilis TaxID=47994 RepID=A0A4Q7LVH8_9BURK|nr:hypothetical protein EV685_1019 [Sphaerotilus mobilis]